MKRERESSPTPHELERLGECSQCSLSLSLPFLSLSCRFDSLRVLDAFSPGSIEALLEALEAKKRALALQARTAAPRATFRCHGEKGAEGAEGGGGGLVGGFRDCLIPHIPPLFPPPPPPPRPLHERT